MSQWYEIWTDEDLTSITLLQSKPAKAHHREVLVEMGEQQRHVFRASSWKRAKARYRRWLAARGVQR